jgi:hypothetical protein
MLLITEAIEKHLTPTRVRATVEQALEPDGPAWDDVNFIARIYDTEADTPHLYDHWLVAFKGDQPISGATVACVGEWLLTTKEIRYGGARDEPPLRVTTADRVQTTPPTVSARTMAQPVRQP